MASSGQNSEEESKQNSSDLIAVQSESIFKSTCRFLPSNKKVHRKDKKRLMLVSIVCLIFIVAEVVGGILSNSIAIVSDAAHLLSDFGAFMVSLAALWISSMPRTRQMSFGFHRAEVIGALISVLSIWVVTGVLVYMAAQRIIYPAYEIKVDIMIYVAAGGILANLVMGIILVTYGRRKTESDESINIKSAVIHVLGDLLQSIGVLIAGLVIYFKPELKIVDPICTFFFSIIVLATTMCILRDIFYVLMEGFPRNFNFSEVKNVLFSVPGVVKIHNLRMWSLTMDEVALSAHIVIRKGENQAAVLKNASQIIHNSLKLHEVTLQVEEIDDPVNVC